MSESNSDILDIVEEPGPEINDQKLFKTIWLQPRYTIRYLLKTDPDKHVWPLLVLGGVVNALGNSEERIGMSENMGLGLLGAMIGGALLGPLFLLLYALLLKWTSGWLNGRAKYTEIRTVVAWAQVPSIASLVLFLLGLIFFGRAYFTEDLDLSEPLANGIMIFLGLAQVTLGVWSFVISVIGLSEANKFGIGKALLSILLAILVILVPIAMIAFLIGDFII